MKKTDHAIIESSQMKELVKRNNPSGLYFLALHVGLIALFIFLLILSTSVWADGLLTLGLGVLLVFLFAPLHESIHKTAFQSQWLNSVVGIISGFILFLPSRYFQSFHMTHHRFTQIPDKDPELLSAKPNTIAGYLLYLTGLNYWKEQIFAILGYAFTDRHDKFVNDNKLRMIRFEAQMYVLAYVILFGLSLQTGSSVLLKFWILPVIVAQPALRGFLLAEHALCPKVKDMFENTRTTATNFMVRRLCWNMNCHVEHHVYPAIPFHQLPETHKLIKDRIKFLDKGYFDVHRKVIKTFG
jgi:fatty acid desaturase